MIGPILRLIYLLTYLNPERMLLGSRWWFDVNGLVYTWIQRRRSHFDGKFVHF